MQELEQEDPTPQGDLALQITALPREANGFGDIYGGWLVSQMDLAGTAMASRLAAGRVATVAIDRMMFAQDYPWQFVPGEVGALDAMDCGAEGLKMFFEDNARKLFRI